MSKTPVTDISDARAARRAEAEARFARGPRPVPSEKATPELLQDLQVHQIELEMQNEELRRGMQALEEAHDRYRSLYEFAPVGYVTVNADGTISEINRAGEPIFGVDRSLLQGNQFAAFVVPEDGDRWHLAFHRALTVRE